ncbi:MAG: hypothetical protein KDA32_10420 [Phycisphaerales bacterium]|nr:hypothetical protein [Phycisphaerales bacterium]
MLSKLYAIAWTTFFETIRQPIYSVLLWATFGWLLLAPLLAGYSLQSGNDTKILIDVGVSTMLLYGLLISCFAATGVITREIESMTAVTVISKPVGRPTFVVGKFLGVIAAVSVGYLLLSVVFLMEVRHGVMETVSTKYDQPVLAFGFAALGIGLIAATFANYVYGAHFPTTLLAWVVPGAIVAFFAASFFDKEWDIKAPMENLNPQVLFAVASNFCAIGILTALAVALATRLSQIVTLVACGAVFLLGLLSSYYFGRFAEHDAIRGFLYHVVPNFQFFWFGDAITLNVKIHWDHVVRVAAYAGLYTLAILSAGVAMFQTREVG